MTEKRYFKRMWEEEYYIFDSQQISEKEFDEKVEYEDYRAFADSMDGDDVVNRLNELNDENQKSKELFLLILKKLGRNNPQCDFCMFGEFYESYENHGKDITHEFICRKGHGNYTNTISLCPDWGIEVKE